jgi:hypothetical protein
MLSHIPVQNHEAPTGNRQSWLVIIGFCGLILSCLVLRAGILLVPIFPLGSLLVGLFLYHRSPALYIGWVWWSWLLASGIRRVIDFQAGYFTPGPASLASLLVTAIPLLTFLKDFPILRRIGGTPFIWAFGGIAYGFISIAVISRINARSIIQLLEWADPVVFGYFIFKGWRNYPAYRDVLKTTFLWGLLITSSYGIIQFISAPGWDCFWLDFVNRTAEVPSFGDPAPFKIRVFSTAGSPQSFANTLVFVLPILFTSLNPLSIITLIVGLLASLLSLARAAWIGTAVAALLIFPLLSKRSKIAFPLIIALVLYVLVSLVNIEPFSEVINSRLETFSGAGDGSADSRKAGYAYIAKLPLLSYLSLIIPGGAVDTGDTGFIATDSTIFPLLSSLGLIGSIPYIIAVGLMLFTCIRNLGKTDSFSNMTFASIVGILAQSPFNFILHGNHGMALWCLMSLQLSAYKYSQWHCSHHIATESLSKY